VLEVSNTEELYRLLAPVLETMRADSGRIDTMTGPEFDSLQRTFRIKGHYVKPALQYVEEFAKGMYVQRTFLLRRQHHLVDREQEPRLRPLEFPSELQVQWLDEISLTCAEKVHCREGERFHIALWIDKLWHKLPLRLTRVI